MIAEERRERIVRELARRRFMSVSDVAAVTGCSLATAHRDLVALGRGGRVRLARGGAIAAADVPTEGVRGVAPDRQSPALLSVVKRRIAAVAVGLVEDGDTVGLGGGTTTFEVARRLRGRKIGAVTNAIDLARELASEPGVRVVLVGGVLSAGSDELVGPLAETMLAHVHIDTLFLSVDGLSAETGATIIGDLEAQVLRAMARRARRVVVVADHSKIGRTATTRVLPIEDVYAVVTDAGDGPAIQAMRDAQVRVAEV